MTFMNTRSISDAWKYTHPKDSKTKNKFNFQKKLFVMSRTLILTTKDMLS